MKIRKNNNTSEHEIGSKVDIYISENNDRHKMNWILILHGP